MTIGAWRASPAGRQCSHGRVWWELAWSDRIVEAMAPGPDPDPATIDLRSLVHIGAHAWRVLDERAAAWPIVEWALPIVRLAGFDLPPRPAGRDLQPLVDVAIGGALVSLHAALPDRPPSPDDRALAERIRGILARGALLALRRVVHEVARDLREAGDLLADRSTTRRARPAAGR